MLESLFIKNFVIVDELEITFEKTQYDHYYSNFDFEFRFHFRFRIVWQPVNKRQGFIEVLSCLFQSFVPWNYKVFTFDLFCS